jgi:hypothetical protein
VGAAIVLGSTLFREQVVSAATTPFQNVVVQNTNTNPIPVQQVGTSTTSVSGTVGVDPGKNTVKLDSNLANIESALGNLKFDNGGNLETAAQTAAPGEVTGRCITSFGDSFFNLHADKTWHTICSDNFYATDITAASMNDSLEVLSLYNGNSVLDLTGSGLFGQDSYQLDLTHPLHVDEVEAVDRHLMP